MNENQKAQALWRARYILLKLREADIDLHLEFAPTPAAQDNILEQTIEELDKLHSGVHFAANYKR